MSGEVAEVAAGPPVEAGEGEAAAREAAAGFTWQGIVKTLVTRMLIIYFISSLVSNWKGKPEAKPGSALDGTGGTAVSTSLPGQNLWNKDQLMDLWVYVNEEETFKDFDSNDALVWHAPDLIYGDWTAGPEKDGSLTFSTQIPASSHVQNNGSIYIHVFITKAGRPHNPEAEGYTKRSVVYQSKRLNRYKKRKYQARTNLLTGETEASVEEQAKVASGVAFEILNHWHPNLTLNLIADHTPWQPGSLPPPLDEAVKFDRATGNYFPIFFFNDYWNLASEYQPLNDTVPFLNLTLTYSPMSLFKWQMYASQQVLPPYSLLPASGTGVGDAEQVDEYAGLGHGGGVGRRPGQPQAGHPGHQPHPPRPHHRRLPPPHRKRWARTWWRSRTTTRTASSRPSWTPTPSSSASPSPSPSSTP